MQTFTPNRKTRRAMQAAFKSASTATSQKTKVIGEPVNKIEVVSVDINQVGVQRFAKPGKVKSYVKKVGGFDWRLFGVITVARYPDGKLELVDGGHRLKMLREYLPTVEYAPAIILDVQNEEEAATLFHRFNGTASSPVNAEERFVAEVMGAMQESVDLAYDLKNLELKVVGNSETGSYVGDPNGRVTKISKFKAIYKGNEYHTTKAMEVINQVWSKDQALAPTFLQGLVYLLSYVFNNGDADRADRLYDDFVDNITMYLENLEKTQFKQMRDLTYPELRKDNHYGVSIAHGLYNDYYAWISGYLKQQGRRSPPEVGTGEYPVLKTQLESLYKNAGKKSDTPNE